MIYFLVPVYDFEQPQPFTGGKIYNPYRGMDSASWKKSNSIFMRGPGRTDKRTIEYNGSILENI